MVWARGMLYKAVTYMVILYGRMSWVVMGGIMKVLEGFQHRAAQRIAGMTTWRSEDGEWEHPPVDDALEAARLWSIKEYTQRQQAIIMVQVDFCPIYELW